MLVFYVITGVVNNDVKSYKNYKNWLLVLLGCIVGHSTL